MLCNTMRSQVKQQTDLSDGCGLDRCCLYRDTHLGCTPVKSLNLPNPPCRHMGRHTPSMCGEICSVCHLKVQQRRHPRRGQLKNRSASCRTTIKLSVLGSATAVPTSCLAVLSWVVQLMCPCNLTLLLFRCPFCQLQTNCGNL